MKSNEQINTMIEALRQELPTVFARKDIKKFFASAIAVGTVANLSSQGLGPKFIRNGRNCIYCRDQFLAWFEVYLTGGIKALEATKGNNVSWAEPVS